MAGPTIPEIYCWETAVEDLSVFLASTAKGAFRIGLALEKGIACIDFFRKLFPKAILSRDYHLNKPLVRAVKGALMDSPQNKQLALDVSCTHFQWQVLEAIKKIPFGKTITYGEVASMIGKPAGARAVGQALGRNPLPLLFP